MLRGRLASFIGACVALASSACCVRRAPAHAVCPIPRSQERDEFRAKRDHTAIEEPPLGVVPEAASVLNPSEVRIVGDIAATLDTPAMSEPAITSYLFTQELSLRLTHKHVSAYVAKGYSQQFLHGDERKNAQTNWRGSLGIRHVRGIESNHVRAMGLRVDVAHGDEAEHLLAQRPIDAMRFSEGLNLQAAAEVRYELLGCFAPFLHMQLATRRQHDGWSVPISAVIGAHREVGKEPIMIWGGYEITGRRGMDEHGRSFDQRVRLGAEAISIGDWGVRLGAAFEIMVGPIDGTFAGVTATVPFDLGKKK